MSQDIFHVFMHFPADATPDTSFEIVQDLVDTMPKADDLQQTIQILIDRSDCEKGVKIYYGETNLANFVEGLALCKDFEEDFGHLGTYTLDEAIYILLQDVNAQNWEYSPQHDQGEYCRYKLWDFDSNLVTDQFPEVLKEIAEISLNNTNTF